MSMISASSANYWFDSYSSDQFTNSEIALATWLQRVEYHSNSGSYEDQNCLVQLAYNLPSSELASDDIKMIMDQIRAVVEENKWDPQLPFCAYKALLKLMRQLSSCSPQRSSRVSIY